MNKKLVVLALALCGATASFADDACVPCEVIDAVKNLLQSLMSMDPNEITGPAGVGAKRYVKPGAWMDYTIYFENRPDATAAAQEIRVTLPKDPGLDWSALELGEVAFGDNIDSWFAGKASGENTSAPSGSDTQVKTVVTVTDETVEWYLRSWDPNTPDHFPANVAAGFLPPNDPDTHCGEGHVRFRVKVKDDAEIGSKINASATIVFDANPPITTDPAWWNTVGQVRKIVVSVDGVESEIELFEGEAFGELPDPGTPPENCVFDGWYTKPGGNGYRINAYSTVEAGIEAIYAHWIPYVAEMNGVKYTSLANAVKKCPYNASETNEIKILSDVEWEDRQTYEYVELTDPEVVEAKQKGRWKEYASGSKYVFYKHKAYYFGSTPSERVFVVKYCDDDWAFFTGQNVAVDLGGHWHTNAYVQIDCADVVIRDSSPEKTGAVELQVAADLSYGGLTLESGKLIAGSIERDRATVLVCDTAGRFDFLGGEIVAREDIAAVYVSNGCIRVGGNAVATNVGCNVVLDLDASLELAAPLTGRIGITTENDVEGAAVGLNPSGFAGAENLYCDNDPSLRGRTTEDGEIVWEREGQLNKSVGRYCKLNLVDDLGVEIPSDVDYAAGDKVTVKVEGLAKGLKVVATQQKETTGKKAVTNVVYTIEGVPTEAVDFEARPMYARVTTTYKDKTKGDKGKAELLQPIGLSIMPQDVRELTAGVLNEVYGPVDIAVLWPEVADAKANPKDWSFKGWPAGVKYNATTKDANWSYKDGKATVKTNAEPWTVYGQPTKAGEYPITATWKHKLADGKTTVSETFSAVLTVWGDDGKSEFRYEDRAYVATATKTLDATWKSFSGLPTGIKYTTKLIKADAKKGTPEYPAFSLYGTPTKAGVFAVTATKVDPADPAGKKTVKETFLWKVAPAAAPEFALDTGTASVEDLKAQIVQGANQAFAMTATAGAKVSVSGLPSGLKLVQDKATKAYSVEGVASKPGEYFVTFKTVLNGVTTVTTKAFTVKGNPFVGTYCGYACARPAGGPTNRLAVAEVSVAAAGTVKLTYTEGKTKYTASVKNFDWDDATGKGTAEGLVLKVSSADKKLGYGDRKATVTFEDCGIYLKAKLVITDANGTSLMPPWTVFLYATVKTTEVPLPASQTYVFRTEDGTGANALATVSAAYDAKKATATFSGKLSDGTAVKATVPVLRRDDEGTPDDYVFAPFMVIAKDGTVCRFDRFSSDEYGGFIDWVGEDGETVEESWSANADYAFGDKKFAELVPEAGAFTFGWGSDAETVGAAAESFTFAVTKDKNNKPAGVAIYDADPQPDEKPLATVTAKVGKMTGAISVSFTSKKGDKAKYAVELVWRGDQLFAGHVTRTWKATETVGGKPKQVSHTAYGTAEVK